MSLTKLVKEFITEKLISIDFGIDATCGNGLDTLFLAGLCNEGGMIFSFDVQDVALDRTEKLLNDNNITQSVMLVNSGHENMEKLIKPKVDVIMFNLGSLPNSDNKICTKPETTIPALESAVNIVREGGMITVLCYPGTDEGQHETVEVKNWIAGLDNDEYIYTEYKSENPDDTTPVLYVIKRL